MLDHLGPAPSGSPEGEYAFFRPEGGTVHLTLDMVDGHCTGHGETDIGVDPNGGISSVQQGVERPTYTLYAAFARVAGHRVLMDRRNPEPTRVATTARCRSGPACPSWPPRR